MTIRLAFQSYLGDSWRAGLTAVTSLVHGLHSLGDTAPEMALVVYKGTDPAGYETIRPHVNRVIEVPYSAAQSTQNDDQPEDTPAWSPRNLFKKDKPKPRPDVLNGYHVNCTFTTPLARRPDLGAPIILYLPDYQHAHLPHMFTPKERAERDKVYRREIEGATLVLVTAEDVRQDIKRYVPDQVGKVRLLPFVVPVPTWIYERDPAELAAAYHLPEKFFWLPNQFWKHKNHQAVLEALSILQQRNIYPNVVCAGNPLDHRDPGHFSQLLRQVSRCGLRDQFIVLGILPHEEILTLMRQAICLLNPSLFEGFGFSVAESKLVGKRALLSDLPSHREQDPPDALYFDPTNVQELADKMAHIWQTAAPGPDLTLESAARQTFPAAQQTFGRTFLHMIEEAITLWPSN